MKKSILILLVAALFILGLPLFAGGKTEKRGHLVVPVPTLGEEDWLSPMRRRVYYYTMTMYDSLLQRDQETGEICAGQGGLAESFEVSEDVKTFTFHLVKGAQFHDGWGEVTSADVKYSFELAMLPESVSAPGAMLRESLASPIETPDPYTVVVRMKEPNWAFLDKLTSEFQYFAIVCKKYVESVGLEQAGRHPIGSGPFKFADHVFGVHLKVEAVEDHWYKAPRLEFITFKKVPDPATRLNMLKAGEAHLTAILYDQIEETEDAGLVVQAMPNTNQVTLHYHGCFLNPGYKPEDTPPWAEGNYWEMDSPAYKVRLALSLAIDRQAIADEVLYGFGTVGATAFGFFPNHPGFDPTVKPDPYDPERALQLLKEAGYANPKDLVVTVDLTPHASRPWNRPVTEAIGSMWEKLGITVKTRMAADYNVHCDMCKNRETNYAWAWSAGMCAYPIVELFEMAGSRGYGIFGGESVEYDRLIEAAMEAASVDEMEKTHAALFNYVNEIRFSPAIVFTAYLYAKAPNLVWPSKAGPSGGMCIHNYALMYFEE